MRWLHSPSWTTGETIGDEITKVQGCRGRLDGRTEFHSGGKVWVIAYITFMRSRSSTVIQVIISGFYSSTNTSLGHHPCNRGETPRQTNELWNTGGSKIWPKKYENQRVRPSKLQGARGRDARPARQEKKLTHHAAAKASRDIQSGTDER